MFWDKVVAQDTVKQTLKDMVDHNRLSHALLFLGKEGSGALPLALAFAQHIITQPKTVMVTDMFGNHSAITTPVEEGAIHRAATFIHPDLHLSFPTISGKSSKPISSDFITDFREFVNLYPYGNAYDWLQFIKAENKQGNITAEECLDIIKKLSFKSYESEYKVLVMWLPEYLGVAGNKLLKLIEEPPAKTIFILVAENEEAILPTILSRCQLVKVPLLTTAQIKEALQTRCNLAEEKAAQIANISEGNYRLALQSIQHANEDWLQMAKEWLRVVVRRLFAEQITWVDDICKQGRENQKQFLLYFIHLLEQSIKLKVMGEAQVNMPEHELDFANRTNKIMVVSQTQALINLFNESIYYIERNANNKMLFMSLTIKMYYLIMNRVLVQANN